jgi:hypothetical protein
MRYKKSCVEWGNEQYSDVCRTNIGVFLSLVLSPLVMMVVATTEICWNVAGLYKNVFIVLDQLVENDSMNITVL